MLIAQKTLTICGFLCKIYMYVHNAIFYPLMRYINIFKKKEVLYGIYLWCGWYTFGYYSRYSS